jgi:hypothetical protein
MLLKRAAAEAWQRNEADAAILDGRADLPFEQFCRLWHEASGSASQRARYVEDKAGGNYRNHLNRYYNNRADVDDWDPG